MKRPTHSRCRTLALLLLIIPGLVALSGCATLGKDECLNADWFSIGFEDGARGYKASYISRHRKACAKHGVAPDFATYERGRTEGLGEWCTPRNGYSQGVNGRQYNGVCPQALEAAYVKALNQGRDVYFFAVEVKKQEQELKKIRADLDATEMDLADLEDELVRPGVSPMRRRQVLSEIRVLEDDRDVLLGDMADMEDAIADMQRNLEDMRAQNPYR